jgi:aspartyl-tRNA(Asn)/glutamyl-tRNA(Gln) amidotransferase subunit C
MEVTTEIFEHIATLAKLRFEESDKNTLRLEMQKMVTFVEKLHEVDTTNVAPLTHMSQVTQNPRTDVATVTILKNETLKNAGKHDGQYFLVPKVIEQ